MRVFPVSVTLVVLPFSWSLALAAEEVSPGVSTISLFWQTLGALSFIVLLLIALAFLGRKFMTGQGFGQSSLKLLGGLALGPRERIILVKAGEDLLVIGIVPGQIRTLHRMKDTLEAAVASTGQQDAAASISFARAFTNALKNLKKSS